MELGVGVAGVGAGQEQQQQQSESEVVELAGGGVCGADDQHVFSRGAILGVESQGISKELRIRRAGAATRAWERSRR